VKNWVDRKAIIVGLCNGRSGFELSLDFTMFGHL